jgi:hypothetical protein
MQTSKQRSDAGARPLAVLRCSAQGSRMCRCLRNVALGLVLIGLASCARPSANVRNPLPPAAQTALAALPGAELVSLEPTADDDAPGPRLEGYHVLGAMRLTSRDARTAASAIREAVSSWNGAVAACFEPRHAIRARAGPHSYELLICYACQQMEVYEDGKLVGSAGVTGSPATLNRILSTAQVPISHSDEEAQDKAAKDQRQSQIDEVRWAKGMPASVKPIWRLTREPDIGDLQPYRIALEAQYPDQRERILALLRWFGSGAGPWSGFPIYEEVPEQLLLDFPTLEIVGAIQGAHLADDQVEGAARLFGGWDFRQQRPKDRGLLPPLLRRRLLEHSLKSRDQDKIQRAKAAFRSSAEHCPLDGGCPRSAFPPIPSSGRSAFEHHPEDRFRPKADLQPNFAYGRRSPRLLSTRQATMMPTASPNGPNATAYPCRSARNVALPGSPTDGNE